MQTTASIGVYDARHSWLSGIARGIANAGGFIRKDLTIAVSYRLQFVFQLSQVFFRVTVVYFIGQMVSSSGTPGALRPYGVDYFAFALVGLAVNSYLNTALVTITNNIRQMMNQGVLEAMCATPIGYFWLLLYTALWPFLFATIRVGFYLILGIGVFRARLGQANWLGAALTMGLAVPIFLMLGIASSSILILVKRGDPVNWFFTSISGLLAGTMFPITVLPGWLQVVALCLPLTHALEAMRRCLLTGAALRDIAQHLLALMVFMVVLLPATVVINRLCMVRAKKTGAFSTH
jgi:ABC-2 type transport system permease protein